MNQNRSDMRLSHTSQKGVKFYEPIEITSYHKSRELAMQAQDIFSRCGIDPDTLKVFAEQMIHSANKELTSTNFRSDMAVIGNNILARLKSPVDELCAIRMGAISVFLEDEDPNKVVRSYTEKKMRMAEEEPDVFDFFLQRGIAFTPEYVQHFRTLEAEDYFEKRAQMLNTLTPQTP